MLNFANVSLYLGLVIKVRWCQPLVMRRNTRSVLWFRHGQDVEGPVSRTISWEYWVEIPTYVGNDNSTAVYQIDSFNTVTNVRRLNGFLGSNR